MQRNPFCYKINSITLVLLAIILTNFTSDPGVEGGSEYHPLNIYGTLTTAQDKTYNVENISLSGQYKNIPFYAKPEYNFVDPSVNITRIDLADIASLSIPANLEKAIHKFKHREYIEVTVNFKQEKRAPEHFIVERRKKIFCYEKVEKGPSNKKEVSLEALKNLTINGYTCRDDKHK